VRDHGIERTGGRAAGPVTGQRVRNSGRNGSADDACRSETRMSRHAGRGIRESA